ncbi:putative oxidoreductase [Minicystis rosea]|nr:putative oxidoreductase [Minicystis rosea]
MGDDLGFADALREIASVASYPAIGHRLHRRGFREADLDVRLDGQVHVVTGGTAGIGLAIARGLANRGATVVIVGRDPRRAEAAKHALGTSNVEIERADLASVAETHALAERLLDRHPRVHALINNAGVILWNRSLTEGVERTFATNVLGGFVLAHRLLPALARAAPARLVHITSAAIYTQRLDVDGLLGHGTYRGPIQYARTKRAQVELSALWAERLAGLGVTSNCAHPGLTATPGTAASVPLYHRVFEPVLRDPDQGADTAVWLAASPAARDRTGELFFDRAARPAHVVPWTRAPRAEAERLWAACASLAGIATNSLEVKR